MRAVPIGGVSYDPGMTRPAIQLYGMPYVPGTARGVLHRGMTENNAGRIVILEQTVPGPFARPPEGFVVIDAAPLAHAMIPLLGSGIPTVIVNHAQAQALPEGVEVMLDGMSGRITTAITATAADRPLPAVSAAHSTLDGISVKLRISVRDCTAAGQAADSGADAIGLVRSEFLLPENGSAPDADFFSEAFRALCAAAAPLPVIIRLIDIAADKRPAWLPANRAAGGVLGLQGVRLYSREPLRSIYQAQLAAIDALGGEFDLRVLLPYVDGLDELRHWHSDVRQRLSRSLAIGAMAETPVAALQLGAWLEETEFVAVGCNDLMQCLFGADRDRPELCRYLDPHAPPLFRFLRQVAEAAQGRLDRVQLCGVLPQLPGVLPILLGLGFRVFSVEAALLPYLWQTITATSIADASALATRVCALRDSREVRELLGLHRD